MLQVWRVMLFQLSYTAVIDLDVAMFKVVSTCINPFVFPVFDIFF